MPEGADATKVARIKIDIIEQKMKVVVVIKAPESEEEQPIALDDVIDALEEAGIKFGINEEAINEILGEKKWGEMFVAAVGKQPGIGEDAGTIFNFTTSKSLKPQISEDGRVDYKEISVVNSVGQGDLLLRKIPAAIGEAGINVCGEEVPGLYGKDIKITAGQSTYKEPPDELEIKSAIEGVVVYNLQTNTVEVQKLYIIPGSVDYSTGNIHVKSSIEIKGDVKPGFTITTPYCVTIKGAIEQAAISCGGNLTVKGGIVGDGKRLHKVGGDIHAGYISNQNIYCDGSIYSGTEIRNSQIECADEVVLVKMGGLIIGGKVTVSNKISAPSVGNMYNVLTELEVGVNFNFKEKYLYKLDLIKGVQKQMEELRKKIDVINSRPPDLGSNSRLKALKAELQDAVNQLEKLKVGIKEIEKDYYNIPDPSISISKTVFPGTVIKIKQAILEVKEELSHVTFKLVGDQIEWTKLK